MKLYKKVPRYNSTWTHVISDNYPEATLQDIRAAAKELGFAVVPLEPTEAMRKAGFIANNKTQGCSNHEDDDFCYYCGDGFVRVDGCGTAAVEAYKAMLAAAQEDTP